MTPPTILQRGKRTAQGQRTHDNIVKAALNIASVEGLEGLTIGRLAAKLNMSKSGLFAHFGSKEGLQLATVAAARDIFMDIVVEPARALPHGLPRLWALCDGWLSYIENDVFPGGCFFAAASVEFDGRPGPVRDEIASDLQDWMDAIIRTAKKAIEVGDIRENTDASQIAFEVQAIGLGANWSLQLYKCGKATNRARVAILERLRSMAVSTEPSLPDPNLYR